MARNMRKGNKLIQVTATDTDAGDDGEFYYTLAFVDNAAREKCPFTIDKETGVISSIRDFATGKADGGSWNLKPVATDRGNPPLRTQVSVEVFISSGQLQRQVYSDL